MKRKLYLPPSLRISALELEHALLGKSSSISVEKARNEEGRWYDENEGYY